MTDTDKEKLRQEYAKLDPLPRYQEIERKQEAFWVLTVARVISKKPIVCEEEKDTPPMRYYRKIADTMRYQKAARNRTYRTRPDPFADVWSEIEWELKEEASLQANEILRRLQLRHPGQLPDHQIRTLQRRVRDWRLQRMKESVGVIALNLEALFVPPPQNQHEPRNVASNIFT